MHSFTHHLILLLMFNVNNIVNQFLLRQALADDEASTRLLQILLFLLMSTASLMFIPCAVRSSFTLSFVARISLVDDLNGPAPIPAGRDSLCRCMEAPLTSLSAILYVSIMLRFLGPMPGGDHSSPGRVRKPVGPLGPPSPSGVLPTPQRGGRVRLCHQW